MTAEQIEALLGEQFPGSVVHVHSADDVHFDADVVSGAFAGKSPLARHRMVHAALGEQLGAAIHALSLRTRTPEEAAASGHKE